MLPRSQLIGRVDLDEKRIDSELLAVGAAEFCQVADSAGPWGLIPLFESAEGRADPIDTLTGRDCRYLAELITQSFDVKDLRSVWLFCARRNGTIRPHRDWRPDKPAFTRFHIPLRTNEHCFNSEDERIYHMGAGEIWKVSSARFHSAGSFSNELRVHLILDFAPDASPFLHPFLPFTAAPEPYERPLLSSRQVGAIEHLALLHTERTDGFIYNVLASIHFQWRCHAQLARRWIRSIRKMSSSGRRGGGGGEAAAVQEDAEAVWPAATERLGRLRIDETQRRDFVERISSEHGLKCQGYSNDGWEKIDLAHREEGALRWRGNDRVVAFARSIVERLVQRDRVYHVFAFKMRQGGILLPHIDVLRAGSFNRIHVPMQTDGDSFHCEGDVVFSMRTCELWMLDILSPHGAACFSSKERISLAVDCLGEREAWLLPNADIVPVDEPPSAVARRGWTPEHEDALLGLSAICSAKNLERIFEFLSVLPYEYDIPCGKVFDHLDAICRGTGDRLLIDRSATLRRLHLDPCGLDGKAAIH